MDTPGNYKKAKREVSKPQPQEDDASKLGKEDEEAIYLQYAIEAFGPERCMFESNFPVDKDCISYGTLWNLFKKIASKLGLSAAEKTAVFSGTAAKAYRLEMPWENLKTFNMSELFSEWIASIPPHALVLLPLVAFLESCVVVGLFVSGVF